MRETSQTPQPDTPSNKDTLLLKATRVDTKSLFEINGEEYAVLPSDIINTLNFDSSSNAERERTGPPTDGMWTRSAQSPFNSTFTASTKETHGILRETVE